MISDLITNIFAANPDKLCCKVVIKLVIYLLAAN